MPGVFVSEAHIPVEGIFVSAARIPVEAVYVSEARIQVWPVSAPLTLSLYPDWSQGYMYSNGLPCVGSILGGVRNNDVIQGYWDVSQGDPAGSWDHVQSIIAFPDLAGYLVDRPVVKSATLRLTLSVGYGSDPKNTNVILGYASGITSTPIADWNHTDTNKGVQDTGDLFTTNGQTKTITLNSAMRAGLQGGAYGIALHDPGHGTSETVKRSTRAIFDGASAPTSERPLLTVTLDAA